MIDSINFWRIGTKAHVKKTVLAYCDYVFTDSKSHEDILRESKQKVDNLADTISKALIRSGFKELEVKIQKNEFHSEIKAKHLTVVVDTTNLSHSTNSIDGINSKIITTNLFYNSGCLIDLDRIVSNIEKQYWIIEYQLEDDIDVGALNEWANRQAGLSPGSSMKINGKSTSIEYHLLDGKLRVGASKYQDDNGKIKGKLTLTQERPDKKWFPHKVIFANHILGFILGNISPRAIMHLHEKSSIN